MPLPRLTMRATFASLLPALAVFSPYAAWADINTDPNSATINESSELASTLSTLSTDTSTSAKASNLNALQSSVDSLTAQLNANRGAANAAQLEATTTALQGIIVRLQAGYTITGYTTSTDAADQITTVTITFTAGNGTPSVMTASIPPIPDSADTSDSSASTSSASTDGSDMLTQTLQQVGMQMVNQLVGSQNPMNNIQATLNGLVTGSAAPLSLSDIAAATPVSPIPTPTPTPTPVPTTNPVQQCTPDGGTATNDGVAVYDVSAGKVYMPDGSVLDAHSGMGAMKDNPAFANQAMNGPTPSNTYSLSMRESPYYGVQALRLTPTGGSPMYGRDGFLAHTKLVRGAANGSHGCVAFDDYAKFLAAYKNGQVKTLVVVAHKADTKNNCRPPEYNTPAPTAGK